MKELQTGSGAGVGSPTVSGLGQPWPLLGHTYSGGCRLPLTEEGLLALLSDASHLPTGPSRTGPATPPPTSLAQGWPMDGRKAGHLGLHLDLDLKFPGLAVAPEASAMENGFV